MAQHNTVYGNDKINEIIGYLDSWEEDEKILIIERKQELERVQQKRAELDIKIDALRQAPVVLRSSKEKFFQDFGNLNNQIKKLHKDIHESKLIIKQIGIYRKRITNCLK